MKILMKDNVVRKARALFPHGNAPNPFHDILHKGVGNSKPHHRKIDFMRATYFTPSKVSIVNEIKKLQSLQSIE